MNQKLFSKDFTLVVIGQIISLFGSAVLRFAMPLYLLNQTGSSALFGTVTALSFIPAILLSPVGGLVADRINKRNIMVSLDFCTAFIILVFTFLMDGMNLVPLITVTLMLLYGIAGAYQPSVQASMPVLVSQQNLMAANSIINTISSFSSLLGPVLGGILYSIYGLKPVLWICAVCFLLSAIMELFIVIPFKKQTAEDSVFKTVKKDFAESVSFVYKEKSIIGKVLLVICGINLFLSALIIIGLPYMVTEVLDFPPVQANKLYGFAQGALAAGGLAGGICTGIFAKKLKIHKVGNLITACTACIFPMGASLLLCSSDYISYMIITICCFVIMLLSTMFTIQLMSFVQMETLENLVGKVISVIMTVCMCAHPFGSALYGVLFEVCRGFEYAVFLFAGIVSLIIAIAARKTFKLIPTVIPSCS